MKTDRKAYRHRDRWVSQQTVNNFSFLFRYTAVRNVSVVWKLLLLHLKNSWLKIGELLQPLKDPPTFFFVLAFTSFLYPYVLIAPWVCPTPPNDHRGATCQERESHNPYLQCHISSLGKTLSLEHFDAKLFKFPWKFPGMPEKGAGASVPPAFC